MKIGISTASLYPLETEKSLEFLCENGIPVTEVFFNSPSELSDDFVIKLKRLSQTYGVEISSIHPCGSVGEPYFLFSEYERRYNEAFDYYKRYYNAASILGAKTVVLHGDSLIGNISMEQYCERLLEMDEAAAKFGVSVSQENVNRYRAATPQNVAEIIRLTKGKVSFTYDIKQSIRAGFSPKEIYNAMRGHIVNVHISDNSNECDCLLPSRGNFDFKPLIKDLKADNYDGAILIEVYRRAYDNPKEIIEAYNFVNNIHKVC